MGAGWTVPIAMLVAACGVSPSSMAEPAFQGHSAEMQRRDESDERRRRALYFDAVDLEIGPQGLPCNHLAMTRPDAVAGPGSVVLAIVETIRPVSARVWIAPGAPEEIDPAEFAVRRLEARYPGTPIRITAVQSFMWCR